MFSEAASNSGIYTYLHTYVNIYKRKSDLSATLWQKKNYGK